MDKALQQFKKLSLTKWSKSKPHYLFAEPRLITDQRYRYNLDHWDKDFILNKFGEFEARVTRHLKAYYPDIECSVSEYFDEHYINNYQMMTIIENPYSHMTIPEDWEDIDFPLALLFYGNKTTGTGPHFHESAINYLISGSKKWMIWGPDNGGEELTTRLRHEYNDKTCHEFWDEEYNNSIKKFKDDGNQVWEFVQYPGDVIVVPKFYTHTIINLENHTCALGILSRSTRESYHSYERGLFRERK